jgi:hypothetical protein
MDSARYRHAIGRPITPELASAERSGVFHRPRVWANPLVTITAVLVGFAQASCNFVIGDLPAADNDAGSKVADAQGSDAQATSGGTMGQGGTPASGTGGSGTGAAANGGSGMTDPDGGCCDCDGDRVPGEQCEGDDCDDDDNRVFTGQQQFFTTASTRRGYDYDCSGRAELEYPMNALKCTGLLQCSGEGFLDTRPSCGNTGRWGRCVKNNLGVCTEAVDDPEKAMGCR